MIAPKTINVTIDGKACRGEAGQTILQIASANAITIPTLCYLKHLSPWGGCRMCIVEIAGSPKVVPSCATPAADGSTVTTNSPRLQGLRKLTLELLFSERNHICPICPSNKGDCDLQQQGYQFGIDTVRYPYLFPALPVDVSGRYLGIDHNRCILCTRCVRTCDEVEGVHTLDVGQRGVKNQIIVDLNISFGDSTTCTECGACVAACPTGALFDKAAAFHGQLTKCDQTRTICTQCPVGCGLIVYTKQNRIVDVYGDPDSPVNHGHLCKRGRYETWAESGDRITRPLVRRGGQLVPVSWDEALKEIETQSHRLLNGQKGLLVTPRLTNETAAALQRLAPGFDRVGMYLAKNEASLCREPAYAPNALSQLADADAVIVLGADPSRMHGVVAAKIRTAVRKRSAKLVMLHTPKSDLDTYADVVAHVVSLERSFWNHVAEVLQDAKRPVLVYGPSAMTSIGVTVLDRLIKLFDGRSGVNELAVIGLPTSPNSLALAGTGIEPVDDVARWLDAKPVRFLHIVASDEADGGASLLRDRDMTAQLAKLTCLVVQASYFSRLTGFAHVVLPATVWSEKTGTITNFEGRSQNLRAVLPPAGEARDDQTILESVFA